MIDLTIPPRFMDSYLWFLVFTFQLLNFGFTLEVLIPHCKRLIQPGNPTTSDKLNTRQRFQIYALITVIGISQLITLLTGLVGVLYVLTVAEQTSSAWLSNFQTCNAVLCGCFWTMSAVFSFRSLMRLVRMMRHRSGAEPWAMVSSRPVLEKDWKEKGIVVVRDLECAV